MLERGTVLGDRFEIDSQLGRGGAAVVYRARDRLLQRPVAVKVLHGRGMVSTSERFEDEARALARLRHPHILEVYEVGTVGRVPYLVTEYAERGSLFVHVPREGLARGDVRRLARQTLEALAYSHSEGLVHRDVKPENVLLISDSVCKLADFGLARFGDAVSTTATGVVVGTPEYLAPEVLRGERAEAPADLYAWACVVYFMAAGRPPHEGTPVEIYQQRIAGELDLEPLRGRVRTVVHEAMAVDPLARPSAFDLLDDLGGEVSSQSISMATARAASPSQDLKARSVSGRGEARGPLHQMRAMAWGLGAMIGGLLMGFIWTQAGQPDRPPRPPPPPPHEPRADPAAVWADRLRSLAPEEWVGTLHDLAVGTPGERITEEAFGHPQVLASLRQEARQGRTPTALLEAAARLPMRQEVRGAAVVLRAALRDRRAPRSSREALYQELRRVRHLDAYLRAAGAPEAYGVAEPMQAYVSMALAPEEGPLPAETPVARDKDPAPGTYRLFAWVRPDDRRFPYLFAPGYPLAPPELVQITTARALVGAHAWTLEEHRSVLGRIHLAAPERYSGASLVLEVANLVPPHVMRVRWNQLTMDYHPDPEDFPGFLWQEEPAWRRVRLGLPREQLQRGWNRIRVETAPLLGLPRWEGTWLGGVHVELHG